MGREPRGVLLLAAAAVTATLTLAGCVGPEPSTGPTPGGQDARAPGDQPYYVYPEPGEFVINPDAAVVRFTGLRPDVLVHASPGWLEWVYTPAVIEVLEPGTSGLDAGETFELAIPGGVAEGVEYSGTWVFDKAEIDPDSRYLVSWSAQDYPGFELERVLNFLYEVRDDGRTLVRLQDPPGVGWTGETFDVDALLSAGEGPAVLGALATGRG